MASSISLQEKPSEFSDFLSAPEMPNAPILEVMGQRKRLHLPHKLKPMMEEMIKEVSLQ